MVNMLREFARRFIGDQLANNVRDEDLLEVVRNNISYINSSILIPIEYINLYKGYEYLEEILESDLHLISKILLLNDQLNTTYFLYLWASYKIDPSFKRNMYDSLTVIRYGDIETKYNDEIKYEDYSLTIKCLASQEYLDDIIDEYCKKRQYKDLMLIIKDSCTTKIYNEVLKVLSSTIDIVKYDRTLLIRGDSLSFLITLSRLCNMGDEQIKHQNITLTLDEWITIVNIDKSLLPGLISELHNKYLD